MRTFCESSINDINVLPAVKLQPARTQCHHRLAPRASLTPPYPSKYLYTPPPHPQHHTQPLSTACERTNKKKKKLPDRKKKEDEKHWQKPPMLGRSGQRDEYYYSETTTTTEDSYYSAVDPLSSSDEVGAITSAATSTSTTTAVTASYLWNKPSPGSTTLEDVLDSLLGLPSASRSPSPGPIQQQAAATSRH